MECIHVGSTDSNVYINIITDVVTLSITTVIVVFPFFSLSEQALRCIEVSSKFEDLSLGNNRPTQLVRRYGNLYTETRLDAFDALEDLPEIADFDDLKGKLLFSVVVVSMNKVVKWEQFNSSLFCL